VIWWTTFDALAPVSLLDPQVAERVLNGCKLSSIDPACQSDWSGAQVLDLSRG